MNPNNKPRGRETNISGQGKDVYRRGSGTGSGPVGNGGGYSGRPTGGQSPRPSAGVRPGSSSGSRPGTGGPAAGHQGVPVGRREASGAQRSTGKRSGGKLTIIGILAALLLGGGGYGLSGLLGGGSDDIIQTPSYTSQQPYSQSSGQSSQSSGQNSLLSSLLDSITLSGSGSSSGWTRTPNTGKLNGSVAKGARKKYTTINGNGRDTTTLMVYMCGADLESKSGMASSDLSEMCAATIGSNLNLIVYTGGASKWNNTTVSSSTNQIYKVENGGIRRLESDLGSVSMTKPDTLAGFIQYCVKNYPANRNSLILWDHGGGSITGYGYDEKFASSGSMSLSGISSALKSGGTKFDFIGFDACLMATLENALVLSPYADYLIASEETEPGIGWYYTNWLSRYSSDPSMSTTDIGKNIADDFVSTCAKKCGGQKTTLSVVDLAELSATVPDEFSDFSASTLGILKNDGYQTVSDARSGAREFGVSSKVDQVDLVSLADRIGTAEAEKLITAVLGAVKYNMTSSNMTNAYGLSVYFPYQRASAVNSAVSAYSSIDMDSSYSACIQKFASLEVSGQAVSGGVSSPLSSLLGSFSGSSGSPYGSADAIGQLLTGLMSGRSLGNVSGLNGSNSAFLADGIDAEADAAYLAANRFDSSRLEWTDGADGSPVLYLDEAQWQLVQKLELNVFVDDGSGFIDLGLDNVFEFTDDGGLIGEYGGTWLAINRQPVAYYHTDTFDDGKNYCITGYVPVLLNGDRANLILVFDNEHPNGYIAGAQPVYPEAVTSAVSKNFLELQQGDVIDFLCDYYSYDGEYLDSYLLGEALTVDGALEISDVYLSQTALSAVYRFTDIYHQTYWTPVMK